MNSVKRVKHYFASIDMSSIPLLNFTLGKFDQI